jgi:hypothetical protein
MIIELKCLVAPKATNTHVYPYIATENGVCTVASCDQWLGWPVVYSHQLPEGDRVSLFKHNDSFLLWLVPALTLGERPSDGSSRARSSKRSIYVCRTRLVGSDQISLLRRSWIFMMMAGRKWKHAV